MATAGWMALGPHRAPPASPRAIAAALHATGLAYVALGDNPSAFEQFDRALAADPGFVPALVDRAYTGDAEPATLRLLQAVIADQTHPLRRCADGVAIMTFGTARLPLATRDASTCDRVHRLQFANRALSPDERVRLARMTAEEFPESVWLFRVALDEMMGAGQNEELTAFAARETSRSELHGVVAEGRATIAMHRLGRDAEAFERERTSARRQVSDVTRILRDMETGNHTILYSHDMSAEQRRHVDSARAIGVQAIAEWDSLPTLVMRFTYGLSWLRMLLDAGRLREAMAVAPFVQARADSIGTPLVRAEVAMVHGRTAVKAGQYDLAERRLKSALGLAREGDVPRIEWEVNHNLLHLYESTGRDSLALQSGLEFARITGQVPMRSERMMSYRDLGVYLRQRGRWEEAQYWFERMVGTVDSLRDGHADFYSGEYLESVGQLERALAFYNERARQAVPQRTLAALTRLSELLGDTARALRQAEEHDDLVEQVQPEGRPLLPGLLARMGRWQEARTRLRSARVEAAGRQQRTSWGRLTVEEASVSLQLGETASAVSLADSALAVLVGPSEREFAMQAVGIAAVAAARAKRADARDRIARLARERGHATATGGATLAADLAVFEGDAHRALGDASAALEAYGRGQKVVDSLAAQITDDATRTAVLSSLRRVSSRALELVNERRDQPGAPDEWRRWSNLRKARTVDLDPTPDGFRTGTRRVVDYVVLDSTIAALVTGPDGAVIRDLRVHPRDLIAQLNRLYVTAAPRVGSSVDAGRARLDASSTAWLARSLIHPLGDLVGPGGPLEIVPDGPLFLVPFDVLPLADGRSLVMERYVVSLAPSLRLTGGNVSPPRSGHALVVAGPARGGVAPPGAPAEAQRVGRAITHRAVRVFTGSAATETTIRGALAGAAVIHLAAHARPNVTTPDFAEVWLAPDSASDGRLQALEIRGLDLQGSTVVLSACETGSGRVAGGEGPMSLARAFVQAGAASVVATLWPVRASASELMEAFHARLDRGLDPSSALREAKVLLLRRGTAPLDLAPFIILASRR